MANFTQLVVSTIIFSNPTGYAILEMALSIPGHTPLRCRPSISQLELLNMAFEISKYVNLLLIVF